MNFPGSSMVERVAVKELQLLRGIVDEKLGEIRETCPPLEVENGNPEPSPERLLFEDGAETRVSSRTPDRLRGKRPTPYL